MATESWARPECFHPLLVTEVRPLTEQSAEVVFAVPPALRDAYRYTPGQHVALRIRIDGNEAHRSYSLCRSPMPGRVCVAIKRERDGDFASRALAEMRPGAEIDVMHPQGAFTPRLSDLDGRHIAAIAAGSGIAPIMSMAVTVLTHSATSRFTLLYANRRRADVMFAKELAVLKDRHPERLVVHHVLSRERGATPLLSGRLDEARLGEILQTHIPPPGVDEWFLCGPSALVRLCRDTLTGLGVDLERLRFEPHATHEEDRGAGAADRRTAIPVETVPPLERTA